MKKKILGILVCMLMIISTIFFIPSNNDVRASSGGSSSSSGLDYDYIWNQTKDVASVTYDAYLPGDIPKGRSYGSKGGDYTVNLLIDQMDNVIDLEDVHPEQIKHIDGIAKNYTSIINMTDFQLTVNNAIWNPYPYENPIPKEEMFVIPCGFPRDETGELTQNFSFNNTEIIPKSMIDLWPFGGTFNSYNFTSTDVECLKGVSPIIVGNVTYLSSEDPIPSIGEQYGRVYLLEDSASSQGKLDNLSRAQASIIIDTDAKGMQFVNASKCSFSVVSINNSDGDILKNLLENYSVLVDNVTGNLTFTYNLGEGWWPSSDHVFIDRIPDHSELWNISWQDGFLIRALALFVHSERPQPDIRDYIGCVVFKSIAWRWLNDHHLKKCSGIFIYDSYDYHYMLSPKHFWNQEPSPWNDFFNAMFGPAFGIIGGLGNTGALPIFTLNYTAGNFMDTYHLTTTATGYADQEYLEETPEHPAAIEAYNVVGNITIDHSPQDAIAIISNRYDGMWGQTPGDSGVGTAVLLGLSKYFKENNIAPKYNLTFLFTTGEEYGFRGAFHYNDSHKESNIKYWFILDQLGFDQSDTKLCTFYNNDEYREIVNEIMMNQTRYYERTGYQNITINGDGKGSEQGVASSRANCDSFCFVKDPDYIWDHWHRTGNDYTIGDCLGNTDRNDVNVTTELVLNLTRYFLVNPDCWFTNISFESFDSPHDGDTLDDSIRATFTLDSILPQDLNRLQLDLAYEYNGTGSIVTDADQVDYIVTSDGIEYSYVFTIPDDTTVMNYSLCFKLYNSTGRINNIINLNGGAGSFYNDTSGSSPWFALYHPLGYVNGGSFGKTVLNNISGSVFTANEDGRADNITAYINLNFMSPDPYKCMLYRASDGQLIGTTTEDWISLPQEEPISSAWWAVFNFTETKPLIEKGEQYIITCWGGDTYSQVYYDDSDNPDTGAYTYYTYGNPPGMALFSDEPRYYSIYCSYTADIRPPEIENISCIPSICGLGENITITAVVTDDLSGVDEVKIRLGQVGGRLGNFTMTPVSNDTYQYVFTDSWQVGQYTYSIWAQDVSTNSNASEWYFFNISANATISIATLQESFGSGEYINITDPPSIPDGYHLTGRSLTYNTYYNTRTGCDVLEVYSGPVNYQNNEGVWAPIDPVLETISTDQIAFTQGYRFGNEKGLYSVFFKSNSGDDWPVSFESKSVGDEVSSVVRMKLLGMGYLDPTQDWIYSTLQEVQSSQTQLSGSSVVYENIFIGADVRYSYGTTGLKEDLILNTELHDFLSSHPPSEYDQSEDESYLVFVTQLDYSDLVLYDAADGSIIYDNTTITGGGIDFLDASGVFQCSIPLGLVYEQDDPTENIPLLYRLVFRNGNTYLLTGVKITDLMSMTFPVVVDPTVSLYSSSSDGYLQANGNVYSSVRSQSTGTVYDSSSWITVGQKYNPIGISLYSIFRGAVFFDTSMIPANTVLMDAALDVYKYKDYSTTDFYLRVQNGQPTYPHDPLVSGDYDMGFYSGNGGQLYTSGFTSGYNTISLTNLSWINTSGITRLFLRSSRDIAGNTPTGNEYVSVYANEAGSGYQPRLVVEYLNQSKIRNTGETNISGYLLIQIQYNDSGSWVVDDDTVNETIPRTIGVGQQLALDLIFNGLVQTDDLSNGNGTYRVYAAFRDPDGDILVTDDDRLLAAWYEFEVTGI